MAETSGTQETGTGVRWRHWSRESFDLAQEEDRPILLSISAVWCYWCHVMDETTYAEAEVADFINNNFIPIRVDNDHRPDVNARYNVGGWPTTAFLTPYGGYIAGATFLPPDQLLAMLVEVKRAYDEDKAGIYDQAAQLHRQRQDYLGRVSGGAQLDHRLVDIIARRMAGAYDARQGGFGEEPKFPSAPILRLFLHLYRVSGEDFYRAVLAKTLDAMVEGELCDPVEGGFYRFCAGGDWTEAQHEKMLEDNISLAGVFLEAAILLDEPRYRYTASRTVDFLLDALLDRPGGGFRGSQGAHSDYFELPAAERQASVAPEPDRFIYTNWTCQAISLLLEASWTLPRPELAPLALELLDGIIARTESMAGRLPHAVDAAGQPSSQLPEGQEFLGDWAAYLNALLDAANCRPDRPDYLQLAEAAADRLDKGFYDVARGGYFDTEADAQAVGYMRLREKPLPENTLVSQALLKLHHATGDARHQLRADNVLSAYGEANRDFGEHAAAYAVAVDRYLHPPVEITIEGSPDRADSQALAVAAARVGYPHVIVKRVAVAEGGAPAMAHVCVDTLCFPPVSRPEELAESVEQALQGPQTPANNLFETFISF